MMRVAVIDGQGGGIGRLITEQLRKALPQTEIIALGTNSIATSLMLKAGANEGASGENAVVENAGEVDVIVGPLGIILAHSMRGELTAKMAEAIAKSKARKFLLPLTLSKVEVIGVQAEPLPHQVEQLINRLKELAEVKKDV
jgi:NAD(P)-dependent dehydrogenase (short-subunit alcohol dehydrogenase family)